ncbi:MAG: winged helix-turn-helix transcriptional regulator [SAR86 cluster bacterium]|jgi:DNA-binding HxlR family transcriptional regulator|uniref:Helix-turn-helix transcriptional regulator n=1 Tax=SAR86 cluster bacterium TaxID=2030880 RepID=A0A972VVA7_9GAMM|nr:helix-turn-helix transcriptional regulator [SAR86 cluster bacterium]
MLAKLKNINAFEILGDYWTLLLVRELLYGASTWSDFSAVISIPPSTLSNRLAKLVAAGCVVKKALPKRADGTYKLTEAGKRLFYIMVVAREWQLRWDPRPGAFVSPWRHECGAPLRCKTACLACHAEILTEDIIFNEKTPFHEHGSTLNHRTSAKPGADLRSSNAEIAKASVFLGDQKALKVMSAILQGHYRFDDIQKWTRMHPATLSARLRKLQLLGLCVTRLYQESPDRLLYLPSDAGKELIALIMELMKWSSSRKKESSNQPALLHKPCGAGLETDLICSACEGHVTYENTSVNL